MGNQEIAKLVETWVVRFGFLQVAQLYCSAIIWFLLETSSSADFYHPASDYLGHSTEAIFWLVLTAPFYLIDLKFSIQALFIMTKRSGVRWFMVLAPVLLTLMMFFLAPALIVRGTAAIFATSVFMSATVLTLMVFLAPQFNLRRFDFAIRALILYGLIYPAIMIGAQLSAWFWIIVPLYLLRIPLILFASVKFVVWSFSADIEPANPKKPHWYEVYGQTRR